MDSPKCGIQTSDSVNSCQDCDHNKGDAQGTALQQAKRGDNDHKGIKTSLIIAVRPALTIAIITIVAFALISLSYYALFYFFLPKPPDVPLYVTSGLVKASVTDGFKFTFMAVTNDVQWNDVTILLDEGYNVTQWDTSTSDLDDGTRVSTLFEPNSLGLLTIYCNVTDILGNGYVNHGDIIVLTTGNQFFDPQTTYTIVIMYEPTDFEICHLPFNG